MNEKKSWIDYVIYVIWAFFGGTGIYELFQSFSKGLIYLLGLIAIIVVFYEIKTPKLTYLGILVIVLGNLFGEIYFGFFYHIAIYDKILHLFSPIAACTFFYFMLKNKVKDKKMLILLSVALLLSWELTWEIWEFTSDHLFGTMTQGVFIYVKNSTGGMQLKQVMDPLTDTIYDMLSNLIGALVWAAGALFFTRNKNKKAARIKN